MVDRHIDAVIDGALERFGYLSSAEKAGSGLLARADESRLVGDDDGLGPVAKIELRKNVADVALRRLRGDDKGFADLGVRRRARRRRAQPGRDRPPRSPSAKTARARAQSLVHVLVEVEGRKHDHP
jgi:hypothetical protein